MSDFFVHRYNPYLVVVLGAAALAVSLILQLYVRRYDPWAYWLAVSMVAVFGTMDAGILHIYLGVVHLLRDNLCPGPGRHLRAVVSERENPVGS